ncbi:Glutathione S-transferase [Orchesella cincta]|uniref:glutathione transferase n=1 Tax=Orchesella cincta TaxID=48709 RepID=A0A1D2M9H7_ORCCI|nr:Glutathione S-transferase [Orchesella cincta]
MSTPKYKLIYFNCQWIAEPIRYLLSYVKEDFEDVRLDWEEWIKPEGKIDKSPYPYEKLPILEDAENGLRLGQKFLNCTISWEKIQFEVELVVEAGEKKNLELKKEIQTNLLEKTIPRYFSVIESVLKKNGGKYLVGNAITWIDFLCAHMPETFTFCVEKDVLANYPTMKAYQQQIYQIPEIKAWITKRPVNAY